MARGSEMVHGIEQRLQTHERLVGQDRKMAGSDAVA